MEKTQPKRSKLRRNKDARWDHFDPDAYYKKNYAGLRVDDEQILALTAQHFVEHFSTADGRRRRAIDVGTGVNLYPAMAMLPFCRRVTLYEFAKPNLRWLRRERLTGWRHSWRHAFDEFWGVLESQPYAAIRWPLARLTIQVKIRRGSIYELPVEGKWDMGTMFFVAESITEDPAQFRQGVDRFLQALKPGAPFVIAFMEGRREGYHVAGEPFPSTDIQEGDIQAYVASRATIELKHIDVIDGEELDDPYSGMVVAYGKTLPAGSTLSPS